MGASVGAAKGRGRRGGAITGINVTPMVDIMLVLLVIMMVSSIYIVSRALKVELPKSASSDESSQSPLTVTLTKDDQVFLNGELVKGGDAELVARFQRAKASGSEPNLVVSADGKALHGWVVHVIDLAKQQGIVKFAINVQSEQ
jgi:biopolymer transport protein ExbD